MGHVLCTIAFALAIATLGDAVMSESLYRFISSALIFALGVYFLYTAYFANRHSCCDGKPSLGDEPLLPTRDRTGPQYLSGMNSDGHIRMDDAGEASSVENHTTTLSLIALTSLSPCIASMPVLIALVTDTKNLIAASLVLFVTSAALMCTLVSCTYVGAAQLDFPFIRRNERKIMGWSLVALGVLTFFVFANHHHHHHHNPPNGGSAQAQSVGTDVHH